jgi:Homeodomain-like domain-containing protein
MPADIQSLSRLPTPSDPEENSSKLGQNGTFGDIDPNYNLSNTQCRAIVLALDGMRWSNIARTLGLSRKTLWRWKTQNSDFQLALADARADRHDFAVERCQNFASRAAFVLAKFLDDSSDDKIRMRAAQLLLQASARFKPPATRRPLPDYPTDPILTPPPSDDPDPDPDPEPELEPKVG